jgi:hypothetical protein
MLLAALSLLTAAAADLPAADLSYDPTQPPTVEYTASSSGKHKSPALAFTLNFFIPGAGYLYNGEKPLYVSLPMIAGAGGLTYIEQFHQFEDGTLREQDPLAFGVMFGSVFAINTGLAIDALREAKSINGATAARREKKPVEVALAPAAFSDDGDTSYGLSLGLTY